MLFATFVHWSTANTFWSIRTTQQWWHTSTTRAAHSPHLCLLMRELYVWSWDHYVSLLVVHISGVDNSIADALSRGKILPKEWPLHRGVAEHLFAETEKPNIELFVSAKNAQLPVFCTRFCEPWP